MIQHNDTTTAIAQYKTNAHAPEATNASPSTGNDTSEYWVTRVVRQMKGCSPAKIDSVIQANLPPRKIQWSQRPDTLEIPGLEGRVAYSIDNLPKCYELGYFRGDTLLHPELKVRQRGVPAESVPYQVKNDDILGSIIIFCFVLTSVILTQTRRFIGHQAQEFFFPHNGKENSADNSVEMGGITSVFFSVLTAIIGSLIFFYHAQSSYNLMLCPFSAYWLLVIYFACFMLFLVAKIMLSSFINWIFFDKTKRQQWRRAQHFLFLCEILLLVPATMAGIYLNIPSESLLLMSAIVVTIFKLGLLFSTYSIFLPHFYGILHLLSYLCALEIVPLLSLWAILSGITERLTITF